MGPGQYEGFFERPASIADPDNKVASRMTYCVGTLLDAGLVMLADSRTNAGVDHINTFRKLHVFEQPGERVLVLMTAGNLALSQAVVGHLSESLSGKHPEAATLMNVGTLADAARCVGDAIRAVHARDAESLKHFEVEFNVTCMLGGQIRGERPRLFNIYSAGNFIEASAETPYFQIGESKYGKPIIDRVINRGSTLEQAAKCALISMDSTIRSNLSVGLPLDLVTIRTGEYRIATRRNIDADDEYFRLIRSRWGQALRDAFGALPDPEWI